MTAQRSMTDEQMLTKYGYDNEPYANAHGSRVEKIRKRDQHNEGDERFFFDPRPECIPSRDPFPFVWSDTNLRTGVKHKGEFIHFDPRPEFARPPVNPILSAFRSQLPGRTMKGLCDDFLYGMRWPLLPVTRGEVEFARAVLTRLAALV